MRLFSFTIRPILGLACLLLLCQSCVKHRELVTLNANEKVSKDLKSDKTMGYSSIYPFKPYQIRPYDQLMIKINAFDGKIEDFLNRESSSSTSNAQNLNYDPESIYFNSYSVNDSGFIYLPVIEKIKVVGMTIEEVKATLDEAYNPYLKFSQTTVKLANMRYTVLGEVNNPGVYYLYNEQSTILDAISQAGDLTDFSNRNKVKLIRQTKEGSHTVYLNINRSDFVSTEYYYIRPSDVLYIEPIKAKSWDVSANALSVVFSAVSLGVLLTNIFLGR